MRLVGPLVIVAAISAAAPADAYSVLAHESNIDALTDRKYRGMTPALRRNILAYYDAPNRVSGKKEAKRLPKVQRLVQAIRDTAVAAR